VGTRVADIWLLLIARKGSSYSCRNGPIHLRLDTSTWKEYFYYFVRQRLQEIGRPHWHMSLAKSNSSFDPVNLFIKADAKGYK